AIVTAKPNSAQLTNGCGQEDRVNCRETSRSEVRDLPQLQASGASRATRGRAPGPHPSDGLARRRGASGYGRRVPHRLHAPGLRRLAPPGDWLAAAPPTPTGTQGPPGNPG